MQFCSISEAYSGVSFYIKVSLVKGEVVEEEEENSGLILREVVQVDTMLLPQTEFSVDQELTRTLSAV